MRRWLSLLLIGTLLFATFSFLAPNSLIEPALALNAFIDPNGDGSLGNWSTTGTSYYTEIDEATRQPTTPTISDNITAVSNNGGSIFQNMNSVVSAVTTTSITVWIYHNDGANGEINVQLYDDNESTTRSSETPMTQTSTDAWHSVTFGSLSLTQAQLDTLSIRLRANKNGGGSPATITTYAMYADVTYSSSPPVFDQSSYRFFNSINSTNIRPIAPQTLRIYIFQLYQYSDCRRI